VAVILYSALVLGGLGALLSVVLLVAARRFAVYEDPLINAVEDALPGANCGGCGFAGCRAFAESIVRTRDADAFCPVGGRETAERIAGMLGMEVSGKEPPVAVVMCVGSLDGASFVGRYDGVMDCRAAAIIDGGERVCPYGCLGLGTCRAACQYDAISIIEGVARVDPEKCTGCGSCVKACPRGIIRMVPRGSRVYVACSSHDVGKLIRGYCRFGCIGCRLCVKTCEHNAVQFSDNLARVDPDKCTRCGQCIAVCKPKTIQGADLSPEALEASKKPPRKRKPAKPATREANP